MEFISSFVALCLVTETELCVCNLQALKICIVCDICEGQMSAFLKNKRIFRKPVFLFDAFQRVSLVNINKSKLLFYKYYNNYNSRLIILTDSNYPNCVVTVYPLSYGVPVRERYGSTLLPATREQHDQNCTQIINKGLKTYV